VANWLSDVSSKDNHIRTSGKANPSATTVVEEIGVSSDNIKQATNPTHEHTEVNSPTTKDVHHNVMGTTELKPHLNNPAQTENNYTDTTHVLHQDRNEDAVKLLPLPQPQLRARTYAQTNPSAQRATQLRSVLARMYSVSR
jgi:hypothetical protein